MSVSVGCNNTCTFCIVPSAARQGEGPPARRDPQPRSRPWSREGVSEVTLLGQNVNAYGVEFGDRQAFGKLLRACGGIEGLERVRFTSPHPAEFTDDVIEAMAETPNVMPSLHMPLQSGSDRVLKAMRRSYRQERFLGIIDRVRAAIPDAAITTDIIVGFPGETEDDFRATLDVVERARFSGAFTFQYSKRPGTPAATLPDQVDPAVVKDRYQRLVAVADDVAWAENKRQVGRAPRGHGRRGRGSQGRRHPSALGPRARQPAGPLRRARRPRFDPATSPPSRSPTPPRTTWSPTARSPYAAPGPGDAWEARTSAPVARGVGLGMPTVGVPAPLPVESRSRCG